MPARIYTRTGDSGETGLFGGARVSKTDARIEAVGAVDELNAAIGVARSASAPCHLDATLAALQHTLFDLGADIATPPGSATKHGAASVTRLGPEATLAMERAIDAMDAALPPLTAFILPGGTPCAAALHVARTVCRRAERRCVALVAADPATNPEAVRCLNRAADLLFVAARAANAEAGCEDVTWMPVAARGTGQ